MPVTSSSSAQSLSSGIWAQIQQQQAQRNADQAEQQARSLQLKARDAQTVADRAQESARSLKVQSSQAQGSAEAARRGLAALDSVGKMKVELNDSYDKINQAVAATNESSTNTVPSAPSPIINTSGQQVGAVLSVTA